MFALPLRVIVVLALPASSDSTAWSTTRADTVIVLLGNILSSTSNAIYITGVQLEVGENASDFEHRSFGRGTGIVSEVLWKPWTSAGGSTTNTNNAGLVGAGGIGDTSCNSFVGHCHAGCRVNKRTTDCDFYDLAI